MVMAIQVYNLREQDLIDPEPSRQMSRFLLEAETASPQITIKDGYLAIPVLLSLRQDTSIDHNVHRPSVLALRLSLSQEDETNLGLLVIRLLRQTAENRLHEIEDPRTSSSRRADIMDELRRMRNFLSSLTWTRRRSDVDQIFDLLDIGISRLTDSSEATIVEVVKIEDRE